MADYNRYQKSISAELISIKNRVRDFIGSAHWGEDGRYKEIILRDVIKGKLPAFANCGTGFVVGKNNQISTQIDIIVYKNDIPVLFSKDDFVIVTQESVLGLIEVKTRLHSVNLTDAIRKSHTSGNLIDHYVFNGIFSYDYYHEREANILNFTNNQQLKTTLLNYSRKVNYISFGKDYFLKYWEDGQPSGDPDDKYRLYRIQDLSFGYFISNLIEDCYIIKFGQSIPESLKLAFYPIENTKEAYQIETLYLDDRADIE